ncbi:DNA helicase [Rhodotorula toruloides]|uniref:DNA helicase n=1 Tax=Rhodotorula toruloides TaxID=5286 RepID=A0A511KP10_RHOTO|nr:DNA helicase [Rhodotorula toruloides]
MVPDSVARWERNPPPPPVPPRPTHAASSPDLDDFLVKLAVSSASAAPHEAAEAALMDEVFAAPQRKKRSWDEEPVKADVALDPEVLVWHQEQEVQTHRQSSRRKTKSRRNEISLEALEGLAPDVEPEFVDGRPLPRPLPDLPRALRRSPPRPRNSFHLAPSPNLDTATQIRPYLAPSPAREGHPAHPVPQPHHYPLHSRRDWRLSSPVRRFVDFTPPSLYSVKDTSTFLQGHNRLIGVGMEAANMHNEREVKFKWRERWAFRSSTLNEFKGEWPAAEVYRTRYERLIALSKESEELHYLEKLARVGTPLERERKGVTIARALGCWISNPVDVQAAMLLTPDDRAKLRRQASGLGGSSGLARMVAEFGFEDGSPISQWHKSVFTPGQPVRISAAAVEEPVRDGPQPPPVAARVAQWHVQGSLLEIRDNKLVVIFEEFDVWPMDLHEAYQIDIGAETSNIDLQKAALESLFFDPSLQRAHNYEEVRKAQLAHIVKGEVPRRMHEVTLRGTDLRELIVPKPGDAAYAKLEPKTVKYVDGAFEDADGVAITTPEPAVDALPAPSIPSALLRDNQLINSWIMRYSRDGPIEMPGDPQLGLNRSQTKAIAMALGQRLSLIQGPPGTGKSQTIVSLIALLKLEWRIPHSILLAAPTHVAVDHLVKSLAKAGLNPLRHGKLSRVDEACRPWTIEERQEKHPLWPRVEAAKRALDEAKELAEAFEAEVRKLKDISDKQRKSIELERVTLRDTLVKSLRAFVVLEHKLHASLLATADVVCSTALGSGYSKPLMQLDFPIVLLDEAAMCTEPVSLLPLMKGAQLATLIGDHKQLPAVMPSKEAERERLHISLFERLFQSGKIPSITLDMQYRMRPSISAFPNKSFYLDALRDAATVHDRHSPPKSRFLLTNPLPNGDLAEVDQRYDSVAFISHNGRETKHRQSWINRDEVEILVDIVGDLLLENPDLEASDIGIITPYYSHTRLVRNTFNEPSATARLRTLLGPVRAATVSQVEVNTVDAYQGREKRVVIFSTVRSNSNGSIGFLNNKRRLNVALTRARDALIVVGNRRTLERAAATTAYQRQRESEDPDIDFAIWKRFIEWCDERGFSKSWVEMNGDVEVAATARPSSTQREPSDEQAEAYLFGP